MNIALFKNSIAHFMAFRSGPTSLGEEMKISTFIKSGMAVIVCCLWQARIAAAGNYLCGLSTRSSAYRGGVDEIHPVLGHGRQVRRVPPVTARTTPSHLEPILPEQGSE